MSGHYCPKCTEPAYETYQDGSSRCHACNYSRPAPLAHDGVAEAYEATSGAPLASTDPPNEPLFCRKCGGHAGHYSDCPEVERALASTDPTPPDDGIGFATCPVCGERSAVSRVELLMLRMQNYPLGRCGHMHDKSVVRCLMRIDELENKVFTLRAETAALRQDRDRLRSIICVLSDHLQLCDDGVLGNDAEWLKSVVESFDAARAAPPPEDAK